MYLIISHHSHCYFCYVPCSRSLSLISEAWVIHLGFGELRVTVQVAHNEYIVSLGEPMHKQRAREKKNTAAVRIYSKDSKEKIQLKLSSLQLGCREKLCSWISRGRNNNQLQRGIRERWTRWLIYSRRQERGLSLSTCMSLLEAHLFGSECFSPPSESRMTSLTTVPRSRALISSGSAMSW